MAVTSEIRRVALAGATGTLGPAILSALISANFIVTILTRCDNPRQYTFPPSVTVIPVDYGSINSLTDALRNQQALISTLSGTALSSQLNLIHAAAAAGVRRFIPSEFGTNTHNPKVAALPIFRNKTKVQEALIKYAETASGGHEGDDNSDDDYNGKHNVTQGKENTNSGSKMSYTIMYTGPFLDWGLQAPFILDIRNRFVELIDDGDREFSCTTLPAVGQAVVGVLKHPEQTRNQVLYIQDCVTTINKLAKMVSEAIQEDWCDYGYHYVFKGVVVTTDQVVERAWDELSKEEPNPEKFVLDFVRVAVWGEGFGGKFNQKRVREDCEKIGVRGMTEEEVRRVVEAAVAIIAAAEERRCSYGDETYDSDGAEPMVCE